ncbi:unnamed protein product [Darwinula stevensoni]|uniref:Fibronectin type-III domain-containing protein n=1 Tax=Darwinula stevensoni TaxID=69355 RepID=A0A7R8XDM1_9CRUS|nr:unnamed protein product [Darwinula stevensoni]CAG0893205.1 unnamed protein product [Darwinula stevensoni]
MTRHKMALRANRGRQYRPQRLFQQYKVYYTTNPDLVIAEWSSMLVIAYQTWGGFTIINDLTPLIVYTVRVQAYTNNGPTPISLPIQVKTQYRGCISDISLSSSVGERPISPFIQRFSSS